MEFISMSASDEEIKQIIRKWLLLLAQEEYDAAVEMISPEILPFNGSVDVKHHQYWTAALLASVINNYGLPFPLEGQERIWKVVPIEDTFRQEFEDYLDVDRESFERLDEFFCGGIQVDLPLDLSDGNGKSDLTAQFLLREIEQGKMVLVLEDIHVL